MSTFPEFAIQLAATIWYDPEQTDDIALLNSIFQDRDADTGFEDTETVTFVLNKLNNSGDKGTFKCDVPSNRRKPRSQRGRSHCCKCFVPGYWSY